ncbi:hypothetical protein EGW08_019657 [Elysia chlorotica]|uniref:Uncharacterized protein n=1 Tax=Elysia chlorotica TaxID=188477 RepID=A0A3S1H5F5_ELYCH|nr:hypothetical protein EGW08_019657 [Elysia chlorotica]
MKNRAMSIGGKDNLAMILDHARLQNARASEYDLHQTIQNRMVRSESSLHFTPQWLDPHLSDYYHRPDFSYLEQLQQQQQFEQHQQHLYQKHNNHQGGATPKAGPGGAANHSNHSPPRMHDNPAVTSSSLAPPPVGIPSKYSPNTNRLSAAGLPPPEVLSLINARRNSVGPANINGQLYAPLIGQGFGGSTNSINRLSTASGNTNGLAFFRAPRGTNSNRSSCNSLYTYPANFNQGIEIPLSRLGTGTGTVNGNGNGNVKRMSGSVEDGTPGAGPSGVSITISASASTGSLQSHRPTKDTPPSAPDSGNASPSMGGSSNPGFQSDEPIKTAETTNAMESHVIEESERL